MDGEEFFFRGDKLPTNDEIFEFVNTRTKYGKQPQNFALRKMAEAVHDIWQKADTCPLSVPAILAQGQKLLNERRNFLRSSRRDQSKPPLPQVQVSEFTKKRRHPSTGRETSKRQSTSIYKTPATSITDDEVQEVLENLLEQIVEKEEEIKTVPRKINLRNDCNAEQKWKKEVGLHLFDVFSEVERKKAESSGMAFDEAFLEDQRGPRKQFMDTSKETKEFKMSEAQKKERERRQKNYKNSAIGDFTTVTYSPFETGASSDVMDDYVAPQEEVSQPQFISVIKTRAEKFNAVSSVLKGSSKKSVGTQVEAEFTFPQVSTRLPSSKNPGTYSNQLNPRILAAGSLMMGIAGLTTTQSILSLKIVSNIMFNQEYILPPSMEKEYRKQIKIRKKLAKCKMNSSSQSTTLQSEIENSRQAVAEIISTQTEGIEAEEGSNYDSEFPFDKPDAEGSEVLDLIQVENRGISTKGRRELSKMLCKPTTMRTAHHLISTLGEQQQAQEMIESQHVNLIPDETARQGGWGKMAGAVLKVGSKYRALRLQTIGSGNHSSWVDTIVHMLKRLATASRNDVSKIWKSIMIMVSDMCRVNMNLAVDVAQQLGCSWKPGQAYCNLHPRLMMSRCIVEVWKSHQTRIGHDKLFPSLEYCNLDASNDSLVKQVLDAEMSLSAKKWAERSWNKHHEITEWLQRRGIKNETGPLREIRFGELEAKALTGAYHLDHIDQFLQVHSDIRNKLTCFLRSVLPMREVILFYLIGAALIGIHIGEPYVVLLMVRKAKMTELIKIFPQLYLELLNPPNNFTQLDQPAITCLKDAWIDPKDEFDPPYPKTQMDFLANYLNNVEKKYLELFCREVSKEIAEGFKRQKGDVFGFGDGSQSHLNILDQVPEEQLDAVETTSISVEQFFGEVDQKTKVSGGCQAKNKICDDLVIKHTEDLIVKQLNERNFILKPLKVVAKELDELQFQFDKKQTNLIASGLKDDEAVILSKETQVQRVVRQCKESHGGPIHNVAELEKLIADKSDEKALGQALNLEIRYRKFTCLLKVATNNELFRQQGIDNKLRITHLKQLLTDDTKPKSHASMSDIEALYEEIQPPIEASSWQESTEDRSEQDVNWLLNGSWPLTKQEQVIVLLESSFVVATVEDCQKDHADLHFMKSLSVKGFPPLSHWVTDPTAKTISTPKESVLKLRPILQLKGTNRKNLKFFLENLEILVQYMESQNVVL